VPGRRFTFNISLPWRDRYLEDISTLQPFHRDQDLLSSDFLASLKGCQDPLNLYRGYFERAPAHDALSQLLYLDTKTYLAADILTKVDRMSMTNSLEVRVPILDHVFVERVTALPASWKLRDGQEKYIFKKLAERVGVPREVVYRRKQGFAMPLVHWIRDEFKQELLQLLLEPRTLQRGYFNPRAVRGILDEHLRGRRDHTGKIWQLLILELWHRNFLEVPLAPRPHTVSTRLVSERAVGVGGEEASKVIPNAAGGLREDRR
jgi:asparagine synthase (glutamine-hydrolysing)